MIDQLLKHTLSIKPQNSPQGELRRPQETVCSSSLAMATADFLRATNLVLVTDIASEQGESVKKRAASWVPSKHQNGS
jgi:hypothetical protein